MTASPKTLALFFSRIKQLQSGCWLWTGKPQGGYGRFNHDGQRLAHRWAFLVLAGHPYTPETHHKCRNKMCVNPDHLQAVDDSNHPDKLTVINRAKTHCPAGHLYSKTNTYRDPTGSRHCITCRKRVNRNRYKAKRKKIREQQADYYKRNKNKIQAHRKIFRARKKREKQNDAGLSGTAHGQIQT